MSDPGTYRSKEEVAYWKSRDPIPKIKVAIQHDFGAGNEEFEELDKKVRKVLDEAVKFAESGQELPREKLYEDVYA